MTKCERCGVTIEDRFRVELNVLAVEGSKPILAIQIICCPACFLLYQEALERWRGLIP